MVKVKIDNREADVPAGSNIIDAAEQLGVEIPTLCYLKGYEPSTSCQVCTVKDSVTGRLIPACGTKVAEGMQIDCETDEIFNVRRTALELLLSEHVGDCRAPCDFACPAHMDIPLMLQQISDEELRNAIETVKEDIALPAVLGRVCPKPCEKGCRRKGADSPVAICDLKRYVADVDLATDDPYLAPCKPDTGKRVAVVGSGPSGLAAVYYLRRDGHGCTFVEKNELLGGRLRTEESEADLPRDVLDGEINQIVRLGAKHRMQTTISTKDELDSLCEEFDAVVLAIGKTLPERVEQLGLRASKKGIDVDRETYSTNRRGVFAVGNSLRGKGMVVRSAADGKEAAFIVNQFLEGKRELSLGYEFSSRIGRVESGEIDEFLAGSISAERTVPECGENYVQDGAAEQSDRCFDCTCSSHGNCKLEYWSEFYGANPNRYPRERRPYEVVGRESSVFFEPGKCIKCELCIKIADRASEPLGLAFVGRGFDVLVSVPFDGEMDEALTKVAADCISACPTAALSFAEQRRPPVLLDIEGLPDAAPLQNSALPAD
ncbi:MAG: 2Fe-2S iron-sulfur cluster-binding protein [Pirellulaceae bacterium]|nr:2Fe-2S iron-sulfur cluster-binding protein [Pirellulaceae bacterium]MDP7017488.1 2Fe-2S iron-sulfur cluster-binding protein [Pirellulaceae bacterium]